MSYSSFLLLAGTQSQCLECMDCKSMEALSPLWFGRDIQGWMISRRGTQCWQGIDWVSIHASAQGNICSYPTKYHTPSRIKWQAGYSEECTCLWAWTGSDEWHCQALHSQATLSELPGWCVWYKVGLAFPYILPRGLISPCVNRWVVRSLTDIIYLIWSAGMLM